VQHESATRRILEQLGYVLEHEVRLPAEQIWRHGASKRTPQSLSLVHFDDPWTVELHTSADRRYAQGSPVIRLDELVSQLAPEPWQLHHNGRVMAPAANVLFLACHASCPFSNLRMGRMVELALLLKSFGRRGSAWEDLVELGELTGALPHAYPALHFACSLRPGLIPQDVMQRCRSKVPSAALRVVAGLTPSTAHAISRCAVRERYMWTSSLGGKLKQMAHDLFPADRSFRVAGAAVSRRIWRVIRGTIAVEASSS
jgi:hypothetical protein